MICPYCKGEGYTHVQWQDGIYHVRTYSVKCYRCDGKGEIEPANEEFIRHCTDEELAELVYQLVWLGNELFDRLELSGVDSKENDMKIVKAWLKEKKE